MTKQRVKREAGTLYVSYEKAEDVIKNLQSYVNKHGANNVTLEMNAYPYDNSGDKYIAIMVGRDETDEEEKDREEKEALSNSRWEECQRQQYEDLKKKFG